MAHDPAKESPESEPPSTHPGQQSNESPPVLRAELQIPQSVIHQYESEQHKQNRREWWKIRIEVATLAAIIVYAIISGIQANQMHKATDAARKSTDLLRQQLVGSQAANVALRLSIYPNTALSVVFDRRGTVAAKEVRFTFRAVRKSIPSLEDIETAIDRTAYEPILSPEQIYAPKEYSLPRFTPSVLQAIRRTEQTIMVIGKFSYDNGFGDIQTQEVCEYWLSGIPNETESEGGANQFYSCEEFPIRMNNVLKARREIQTTK